MFIPTKKWVANNPAAQGPDHLKPGLHWLRLRALAPDGSEIGLDGNPVTEKDEIKHAELVQIGFGGDADSSKQLTGKGATTAGTQSIDWERFRMTITDALDKPIQNGIGGAVEYRREMLLLLTCAQAVDAAQRKAIETGKELSQLKLQKLVNENHQARLEAFVANTSASNDDLEEAMPDCFRGADRGSRRCSSPCRGTGAPIDTGRCSLRGFGHR